MDEVKQNLHKELILRGNLKSVMWKLSLPAIAAMVLFGLNAFLDIVFVGQLMNETALAGVSIAYPLTSVMLGIGSLAGTGAAAVLSIALGNNDTFTQKHLLGNMTVLMLLSTLLFAVPCYIFAEPLLYMMGARDEILLYGTEYFKTTLWGSPFWVYGLGLNFIVRGEGRMKKAAVMMVYGLVVNIILNPVFIAGLDRGVSGAAWATNIGMIIYSLTGYLYFIRGKASFSTNVRAFRYDKNIFNAILSAGIPGFIVTVMNLLQSVVVFNALNSYGTERDIAFYAAAFRILFFLITPLFGLMRALQPVAGINLGAGQWHRTRSSFRMFTRTGVYMMLPFFIVLMLFPGPALHLVLPDMDFTSGDLLNFRVYMLVLPLLPVFFMALTFFPAVQESKSGSIIGLARQLVLFVPAMIVLPRLFGIQWVYWASTLIDLLVTLWILFLIRNLFDKWTGKDTGKKTVSLKFAESQQKKASIS